MYWKEIVSVAIATLIVPMGAATAQVRITEWMYSGDGAAAEFIEFTNVGASSVDMTGWSFDDDSENAGTVSLSAFGTLSPGQSAILSEAAEATFRTEWGLAASIPVIGSNAANLGRSDEINLYDNVSVLVDRLAYGDQIFPGSIRTNGSSGNPISPLVLATNDPYGWALSSNGDAYGSYASAAGDIGNPGIYVSVPEPSSIVLLTFCGLPAGLRIRRTR